MRLLAAELSQRCADTDMHVGTYVREGTAFAPSSCLRLATVLPNAVNTNAVNMTCMRCHYQTTVLLRRLDR